MLCIDINECGEDNGGCNQTCLNIDGSFECSCNDGYKLDANGRTCSGKYCLICIIVLYPIQISMNVMKMMVGVETVASTLKEAMNVYVLALSMMIFAIAVMPTSEMFVYRMD